MTDDLGIIKDAFDEEIKRHKLYKHAKCKTPTQQHERSSKVKRLDDEQIRREKGLSAKPFTSKTDNILWTIVNKGPISSRDIKSFLDKELKADYNITSIAAVLTRLKKLPGVTRTQARFTCIQQSIKIFRSIRPAYTEMLTLSVLRHL